MRQYTHGFEEPHSGWTARADVCLLSVVSCCFSVVGEHDYIQTNIKDQRLLPVVHSTLTGTNQHSICNVKRDTVLGHISSCGSCSFKRRQCDSVIDLDGGHYIISLHVVVLRNKRKEGIFCPPPFRLCPYLLLPVAGLHVLVVRVGARGADAEVGLELGQRILARRTGGNRSGNHRNDLGLGRRGLRGLFNLFLGHCSSGGHA